MWPPALPVATFRFTHMQQVPSIEEPRLNRVARLLLFATVLTPVILLPGFLFPYITTRAVFFRVIVELALGIFLFVVVRRQWRPQASRDPVFLALLAFVAINIIAAAFGVSPLRSMFGDYERMWGVWAWIHLLLFYVLLRTFMRPADWMRFFQLSVAVSLVVALIEIRGWAVNGGTNSTIGNQGLLAPYLFFNMGFACFLALRHRVRSWRMANAGIAAILLLGIFLTQNRSILLGLVVGSVVALLVARRSRWLGVALVCVVAAATVVARTMADRPIARYLPGNVQRLAATGTKGQSRSDDVRRSDDERLSDDVRLSDNERKMQVIVTLAGLKEHPLLGVGPENFDVLWSAHFDSRIYPAGPDQRFDRAHSAYMEAAATSGIPGALAYLGFWVALFVAVRWAYRNQRLTAAELSICCGLIGGYMTYLLFWFVDLNSALPWIVLAAFLSATAAGEPFVVTGDKKAWRPGGVVILGLGVVTIAMAILVHGVAPLRVARVLNLVVRGDAAVEENLAYLDYAFASPAPQKSHTLQVYSAYMASLAPSFPSARRDPYRGRVLDIALQRGLLEYDRQIRRDPRNPRVYIQRARHSLLALQFYGDRKYALAAESSLVAAIRLSPGRVPPRLALASIHLILGDTASAMKDARGALAVSDSRGDTYYVLGSLYDKLGQVDSAATFLLKSERLKYLGLPETILSVSAALERRNDEKRAAQLVAGYLERKYGALATWSRPGRGPTSDALDHLLAVRLPIIFLKAGQTDRAVLAARAVFFVSPPATRASIKQFIADVNAGKGLSWLGRSSVADTTGRWTGQPSGTPRLLAWVPPDNRL